VDPAVSATATSDYTGLAVLSWSPMTHQHSVDEAVHVKLAPARLRLKVVELLTTYPAVRRILVESNQGGILWRQIFTGLPVQIELVAQSKAKVARAQEVLNHYQQGHVVHRKALPEAEGEMVVFPRGLNDDLVDAICSGIIYNHARLTKAQQPKTPQATSVSYL
jgi:phage terminase large subunit-like protein